MTSTQSYLVTGMTCGHCESSVREEVSKVTGVRDLTVDAANGELTITSDLPVDDADVIRAVTDAGYAACRCCPTR